MSNSALIRNADKVPVAINIRETLETDERGITTTKHPIIAPVFVYDVKTGEKLVDATIGT